MKTRGTLSLALLALMSWSGAATLRADPQLNSWMTEYSGQFARVYRDDAAKNSGAATTTWSNWRLSQSVPAYCGVQQILSSTNWVYILTTGLGSHIMGPWYDNTAHTRPFPNVPLDQQMIFRLPRIPTVPPTHDFRHLGEIGMFVDGVRMFDSTDAFSYSAANGRDASPMARVGQGDRVWNRDAWVNERVTFDAAYAHQQNTGRYHYHASPIALRYLLGDHVDYDATANIYTESKAPPTKHSPIVGWMQDGFPVYGPYGYSNPTNAASGVRRMVSGYVPRDGKNGTVNLAVTGRTTYPAWAARAYHWPTNLPPKVQGPNVIVHPIGHYIEDNEYLGDLSRTQGQDFDLDEHNGRWCVTPEFPNGTYAYFTTISADGAPVYPYNMGRLYYGNPTGHLVRDIPELVTTNFVGGARAPARTAQSSSGVTLVWDAGTYQIESK